MNQQKGSAAMWVIVLLIVTIVAGAAYWYLTQNQTQLTTASTTELQAQQATNAPAQPSRVTQTEPATQAQQTNVTVSQNVAVQSNSLSATIDKGSLTSSNGKTVVTGTVSGTNDIAVVIGTKSLPAQMTVYGNQPPQGVGIFWHDPVDHVGTVVISGSSYSDSVSYSLPAYASTNYIGIYNRVPASGEKYTETLLTSTTVPVQ